MGTESCEDGPANGDVAGGADVAGADVVLTASVTAGHVAASTRGAAAGEAKSKRALSAGGAVVVTRCATHQLVRDARGIETCRRQ